MGRPSITENAHYQDLLREMEDVKTYVQKARIAAKISVDNAKREKHQILLAAIRKAKINGVSDYAIGRATGVTRHDLNQKLIGEAMGADWVDNLKRTDNVWTLIRDGFTVVFGTPTKEDQPENRRWAFVTVTTPEGETFELYKERKVSTDHYYVDDTAVSDAAHRSFADSLLWPTVEEWHGGDPADVYERVAVDRA